MGDKALVGTNGGEIYEVAASEREQPQLLLQGHSPGELWGLSMHPKKPLFATGSDDNTLRWVSLEITNSHSLEDIKKLCGKK